MNTQHIINGIFTALARSEEQLHPDARILTSFPRLIQLKYYNCGAVSTAMVLRYFGKQISIESLERQLDTTTEGTSQSDIKRVLRKYGLKIRVNANTTLHDIKKAIHSGSPAIISVQDGWHYSCVYAISDTHVFVMNPSLGEMGSIKCALSKSEFKDIFDNWAIFVSR